MRFTNKLKNGGLKLFYRFSINKRSTEQTIDILFNNAFKFNAQKFQELNVEP